MFRGARLPWRREGTSVHFLLSNSILPSFDVTVSFTLGRWHLSTCYRVSQIVICSCDELTAAQSWTLVESRLHNTLSYYINLFVLSSFVRRLLRWATTIAIIHKDGEAGHGFEGVVLLFQ